MISDQYYYHRLSKENQTLYKKIYESVLKHKDYVLLTGVSYNEDDIQDTCDALTNDNPFLYYVNFDKLAFATNPLGLLKISFGYYYTEQEHQELNKKVVKYTQAIINRANIKNKSESEIVKSIYDVLALNISYDYDGLNAQRGSEECLYAHSILGVLLKRKGVCDGISKAFKYLLNAVGINCLVVTGNAKDPFANHKMGAHAWNIVKINKQNYHIDLTWGNASTMDGVLNYDYYGLRDEDIIKDHKITSIVPVCDTLEENYFKKNNLIMYSEQELLQYIEKTVKRNQSTIYVKLAYNTSCAQAIQAAQEKIMEVLISAGESVAIRSSQREKQGTIMLVIIRS